jgi:hypothetical protein
MGAITGTNGRLDVGDTTHPTEIVISIGPARDPDHVSITAGQTDGPPAALLDHRHDLAIDLAAEHHLDDFHRLVVGHAKAADEPGRLPQPLEGAPDLRPATVDDHRSQPDVGEQDDIHGEGRA